MARRYPEKIMIIFSKTTNLQNLVGGSKFSSQEIMPLVLIDVAFNLQEHFRAHTDLRGVK